MVYSTHREHNGSASRSFRDLDLAVESSYRSLKKHRDEFDSIIVTGISGLSLGAPLALRLKSPLLVLRKDSEGCHGIPGDILGAEDAGERVLFLDDFISEGETRRKCIAAVATQCGEAKVVASYEYDRDIYYTVEP